MGHFSGSALTRAARSAPALSLIRVAQSCGVSGNTLRQHLETLTGRGRCSQTAAQLAAQYPLTPAAGALHPAMPPPAVRAVEGSGLADALNGTAAWAGRHAGAAGAQRSLAATVASSQGSASSKVAADPATPPAVLARLTIAGRVEAAELAAGNRSCPVAALAGVAVGGRSPRPNDSDSQLDQGQPRAAAACSPQLPRWFLERLAAECAAQAESAGGRNFNGRDRVLFGVVQNPNCPPTLMKRLATLDWSIACHAVNNPDCGADLIAALCAGRSAPVLCAAASRSQCPPDVIEELAAERSDWELRESAAASPACPPDLLNQLCDDDDCDVRAGAAANPLCEPAALERLTRDATWETRSGAAANPTLPPHLQTRLAADSDPDVRDALAMNPTCDRAHLETLICDSEAHVRITAARALRGAAPLFGFLRRAPGWRRSQFLP